jgi:uncharacterized protein (UPF0276 family)
LKNPPFQLGIGIGWRAEIALAIDRMSLGGEDRRASSPAKSFGEGSGLGFVEITAENFSSPARLPEHLHVLRGRGVQVVPHGIGLSLGGAERVEVSRIKHLAGLARVMGSPLVSEHIAFVRAGGKEAGHLLPIPRTRAALDVLVENVRAAQDLLEGLPLALENISALFEWPEREFDEAEFLAALVDRTGVYLLLDVANVYANHRNLGTDPVKFFERLPLERVAYVHMGGGYESEKDGVYHDTHSHPVPEGALELLTRLAEMIEPPGVMLERDDDFPDEAGVVAEMGRIRAALAAWRRITAEARSAQRGRENVNG